MLLGRLQHGYYDDECTGLTEDEVYEFFGFAKPDDIDDEDNFDEEDDDDSDLEEDVPRDYQSRRFDTERVRACVHVYSGKFVILYPLQIIDSNIRHDAVPVPASNCPLSAEELSMFKEGLRLLHEDNAIPNGYGATEEELGFDGFDEHEEIIIGMRRQAYAIRLPEGIWAPRMRLWAQGLYVLDRILSLTSL